MVEEKLEESQDALSHRNNDSAQKLNDDAQEK